LCFLINAITEPIGGICSTGVNQSPVNLDTCTVQKNSPLYFNGHFLRRSDGFTLKNSGHSGEIIVI
jgi:carbonic anhydrase